MANIAIVYATKTNHSKKIAEAIGSALNIQTQNIKEKPVVDTADLLFIVGGIYGGVSMPELLEYVKTLDASTLKCSAIITSCASGKQKQTAVRSILEEKGIKVLEEFVCKGAILFVSSSHPNQKDIKEVTDFAEKIISEYNPIIKDSNV